MLKIRARWRKPMVTRRAPRGGKSSPREGMAQVVVWMRVTTGEMRAGEPENGLDPGRRHSLRQQVTSDPQIDDAPIGWRKAVGDPPALHTATVDSAGLSRSDGGKASIVHGRRDTRRAGARRWRGDSGQPQQRAGLWRQTRSSIHQSDPGSMAVSGSEFSNTR